MYHIHHSPQHPWHANKKNEGGRFRPPSQRAIYYSHPLRQLNRCTYAMGSAAPSCAYSVGTSLVISWAAAPASRSSVPGTWPFENQALAGKAEWRHRASPSALLPAKLRRNEEGSREVHGNPHQSEPCEDLCAIPWAPLRPRSEGATREVATGASRPNSI